MPLLETSKCVLPNKASLYLPRDSSDVADSHLSTDDHSSDTYHFLICFLELLATSALLPARLGVTP